METKPTFGIPHEPSPISRKLFGELVVSLEMCPKHFIGGTNDTPAAPLYCPVAPFFCFSFFCLQKGFPLSSQPTKKGCPFFPMEIHWASEPTWLHMERPCDRRQGLRAGRLAQQSKQTLPCRYVAVVVKTNGIPFWGR